VIVKGCSGYDSLDEIFLRLASLGRYPGAHREHRREGKRYGPYPTRCSAFPDNPKSNRDRDWQEQRKNDREVYDEGMKWDAEHVCFSANE
jgi:hypothetical protein